MLDVIIPVYNGRAVIDRTLTGLLEQDGLDACCRRIIVVDDGSCDDTAEVVQAFDEERIHLVRLQMRSGRAAACNAGVAASTADVVLFLDADCRPLHPDLLCRHARILADGHDLSFGPVTANGSDFWGRYARVVAAEREKRVASGDYTALTSCNLAMRRSVFERCGGFHEGYRHYGFEDRDLIASLLPLNMRLHYDPEAAVLHAARTSVAALCRKMEESGRYTAAVFQKRHPAIYRDMKFAQVDVRTAGSVVRALSPLLAAGGLPVQWLVSVLTQAGWLPVSLRISLVRLATGLAYMRGSRAAVANCR